MVLFSYLLQATIVSKNQGTSHQDVRTGSYPSEAIKSQENINKLPTIHSYVPLCLA